MKKNVFALVLAMLMVLVLVPCAVAAVPEDEVKVPADMLVYKTGDDPAAADDELTMTAEDQQGTVDFKATLTTGVIRNVIIAWYQYGEGQIDRLSNGNATFEAYLRQKFNQWDVTGEFTVTITFPTTFTVPEMYTRNDKVMAGFNDSAKTLFKEVERTLSGNTLTIKLAIKDADADSAPGIKEQKLYDGVKDPNALLYLDELTFTVSGVSTGTFTGTKTVTGKLDGYTNFEMGLTAEGNDNVKFYTDEVRAILKRPSSTIGGGTTPDTSYKITFNIDGNTKEIDPMYVKKGDVLASDLPSGRLQGYIFNGWYTDSEMTQKVTDKLYVDKNMTLYGHRISTTLDTEHHYAYVIGYPDETVRPQNNITREEVAMIFYRLLRDDVRDSLRVFTNDFSDVENDRWSNTAISTLANGDYIEGYPDGSFRPAGYITRAEFATMAQRFASLYDDSGMSFSDIEGHWSKPYVLRATTAGWIAGYPDQTFRPESYITRAEVMTIINRVLSRSVNAQGLHADTRFWIDMTGDEWYYYITLEATNSHLFTRQEDGLNENWFSIIPNKTWD